MNINLQELGLQADGVSDDAPLIQSAIDQVSQAGGGRVTLPSGMICLTSSLILKSNVDLHLERGAKLIAHGSFDHYVRPNQGLTDEGVKRVGTPVTLKPSYAYIYAKDAENIAITGEGTIDGNCYAFVKRVSPYYVTSEVYPRPTMIYLEHCTQVTVKDITLQNSPFWTLHPAGCEDVLISQIRVLNPLDVANSDGIDPDHSRHVRIIGCHVRCADDCICLKSSSGNMEYPDTQDILIADCTLISTSAALKIGTEGTGNFKDVIVHDCLISDSNRGISIQIRDGGNVENVLFHDIKIRTRRFADTWWGTAEPITITSYNRDEHTKSGTIRNVEFRNITCCGENGILVDGTSAGKIQNLTFDNVSVTLESTSKWPKGLYDLRPGIGRGIDALPSAPLRISGVRGLTLSKIRTQVPTDIPEFTADSVLTDVTFSSQD